MYQVATILMYFATNSVEKPPVILYLVYELKLENINRMML